MPSPSRGGFDKAYIRDMVKDHEADVAEFRNEAANGKDPQVKAGHRRHCLLSSSIWRWRSRSPVRSARIKSPAQ